MNDLKNVKVTPSVKEALDGLKEKYDLRTQSEVIAMMYMFYSWGMSHMTVSDFESLMSSAKEFNSTKGAWII